ncbi:MAG: hypothetical protein LBL76_07935 [Treponema sp.]|jgi:hypothetical protein|nr:hypothetical protein [Treponema sp.]
MAEEKNVKAGTATVDPVIIKGATTASLNADVVINLSGNFFVEISAGVNVTDWFTNRPSGLSAAVKEDVSEGDTTITITVSGTPTQLSTQVLAITISSSALQSGPAIPVATNPNAKYDIAFGIGTAARLGEFAAAVAGGNLTLNARLTTTTPIDATGVAGIPISRDYAHAYQGNFDGNGGTIKINLTSKTGFLALFGINDGTIHDLTVTGSVTLQLDPAVKEADYIAGVVAYNDIYGTITRVINKAAVMAATTSPTQAETTHNIGGIAGFNGWDQYNNASPHAGVSPTSGQPVGTISQCRNDGAIKGGFNKIGGIAGENAGDIEQCSNTGKITCVKAKIDRGWPGVGGIVGRNGNNNDATEYGNIKDCYNQGEIADNTVEGSEQDAYGGIAGWCDKFSTIYNCYTTGDFTQDEGPAKSGNINPIIGMVDDEQPATGNNYALNTLFAPSKDPKLIGIPKSDTEMKAPAFVGLLNGGGTGPYVAVSGKYPKLGWE